MTPTVTYNLHQNKKSDERKQDAGDNENLLYNYSPKKKLMILAPTVNTKRLKMPSTNSMSQTSNYTNKNQESNNTLTNRIFTKRKSQSTIQYFTTTCSNTQLKYNPYNKTNKNRTLKPQLKSSTRYTTLNLSSIINQIHPEKYI